MSRFFKLLLLCSLILVFSTAFRTGAPTLAAAQGTTALPLAEPGPYVVGMRFLSLKDASRDGRKIDLIVWYPAIRPETPSKDQSLLDPDKFGWLKAALDLKSAPYPLILVSHGYGGLYTGLAPYAVPLASRGFVTAALAHPSDTQQTSLVDRPLDILFVLNWLSSSVPTDLVGLIDTEHVGLLGESFGGYTSLGAAGARIDPSFARPFFDAHKANLLDLNEIWSDLNWSMLAAYRAGLSPMKVGEMWPSSGDRRIRGVLTFAPAFTWMYGEKGLAVVTLPVLTIAGTSDSLVSYNQELVPAYTYLGSKDKYLLTVVNVDHGIAEESRLKPTLIHFAVAFFGFYLQGHQDYAQYLTAKYADSLETQAKLGLVWGPYKK